MQEPAPGEIARSLFQYKLEEGEKQDRAATNMVTFSKKAAVAAPSRARLPIRMPVSEPRSRQERESGQRRLGLEAPVFRPPEAMASSVAKPATEPIRVSREVLFSRLLAGMIDLLLPAVVAFLFTFSASRVLNLDLFASTSLRTGLIFVLSFYFLNSFFFLFTMRQTPGMYLTDLELIAEGSEEIPFGSICLRIGLFLPVAATVVGLLWGFFDPSFRCWHDRLSRTQVVPAQSSGPGPVKRRELRTG